MPPVPLKIPKVVKLAELNAAVMAALEINKLPPRWKGPITIGLIIKPELLQGLDADVAAKQVVKSVGGSVANFSLKPSAQKLGDGSVLIGFIARAKAIEI